MHQQAEMRRLDFPIILVKVPIDSLIFGPSALSDLLRFVLFVLGIIMSFILKKKEYMSFKLCLATQSSKSSD